MGRVAFRQFGGRTAPAAIDLPQYLNGVRSGYDQPAESLTGTEVHAWPDVVVGKKINMREAHRAGWGVVESRLQDRIGRLGRVVPLSKWMLEVYSKAQMSDMLADRFSKISRLSDRDGGPRQRKDAAQKVVKGVNEIVAGIAATQLRSDIEQHESPLLEQRRYDPDNIELEMADRAACDRRADARRELWTPSRYEVAGRLEGYGPYGFGLFLPDEDGRIREELNELDIAVRIELGIDTRGIARDRLMVVQTVDTSPLPTANIRDISAPPLPLGLPLKEPHAYMD